MKRILILILLPLIIVGCSDKASSKIKAAEFVSLEKCLDSTANAAKSSMANVVTNTPTQVIGILANGNQFGCEKQSSGTKGVFYKGWFTYSP